MTRLESGNLLGLAETLYPPFNDLLWNMERQGVFVDRRELTRISAEATRDLDTTAKQLDKFAGKELNWNANTSDVAEFLYDILGLPAMPDEAKSPKQWGKERITDAAALEYWSRHHPDRRPELDTLRAYRRAARARNYATDLFDRSVCEHGNTWLARVHPVYGTYNDNSSGKDRDKTGTATGRLSISNPPLQQIPRDKKKDPYRVRRAFCAPPGHRLVVVDMEQLEVRIAAHIHIALFQDETLKNLCTGADFHGLIAHDVFSQIWPDAQDWASIDPNTIKTHPDPVVQLYRDWVKAVFYGLAYLKSAKSFGATLWDMNGNPIGTNVAAGIVDGVFRKIPAIPKFHDWVRAQVRKHSGMWDVFGVWRKVENSNRGVRQAANQPLQGSGARLVMLWMLLCRSFDLRLQVHDEIHAIAHEDDADFVLEKIEAAAFEAGEIVGMRMPLKGKGSHGVNWDACK